MKNNLQELERQMYCWSPRIRKYYFTQKNKLYEFARFYFPEYFTFDTPQYLIDFCNALDEWKNVFFEWFRWCAKTTITQVYVIYCVANKLRRNIMWYSWTIGNSVENTTYIVNWLIWWNNLEPTRLVKDYWQLFYWWRDNAFMKYQDKKVKSTWGFITENEVYVRAMSLWTSPRWKNFTASDWKFRPDLLIFDDVDTMASARYKTHIDKNYDFMLNEVLWGTTNACQLVFLWNTIYEDWLVPRFREHIKDDKNRVIIRQPIYNDKHEIVWNRFVETDEECDKLNRWITESNKKYTSLETERKRLWKISFEQNYLLIPYVAWQHIVTRDMIRYNSDCINYWFDRIQIWVDPAISEKQWADRFAITVTWFDRERRYVLESIGLEWVEKNIKRAWRVVKNLYDKRHADRVCVETVAYQAVLKTIFKDMWMAVSEIKTSRDKVTRLLEKQTLFEDWLVYFYPDWTRELVDELLAFPNGEHDDYVDSLLFSLYETKTRFFISSI